MNKRKHYLYSTWTNMRARCNSPSCPDYQWYGARGIKICKRWDNFWLFVKDMGDRPEGCTLDRKNNRKGYSKSNCRWATATEQRINSRPKKPYRKRNAKGYTQRYDGKFVASITHQGKFFNLGTFDCPLMAHLAYREASEERISSGKL